MASRATLIAKNLAMTMVFTGGTLLGGWVLGNTFLAVYFQWILYAAFYIVMYGLVLAIIAFIVFLAGGAVYSFIEMVQAIFRRKKTDDE